MSDRAKELQEERFTSWADNGKACEGCVFAYGNTPFDNAPKKGSCEVYPYPKTKPDNVYIDGEKCKRYRERKK